MDELWEAKEGIKVDDVCKSVSNQIGHQWKQLARTLKLADTDIDAIEHDDRHSLKEQIYQLFFKWKMKNGKHANSEMLLNGLAQAKLDKILNHLQEEGLIQHKDGHPIQEIGFVPEQPKLIGMAAHDVEVDDTKKIRMALSPQSPQEEERHRIRMKRLVRLESDKNGPFEEGHMVQVEGMGYGVIRWLGLLKEKLSAGIEFEDRVPGGGSGVLDGTTHFTCEPGFGLFLPYKILRSDTRFPATPKSALGDSPVTTKSVGASPVNSATSLAMAVSPVTTNLGASPVNSTTSLAMAASLVISAAEDPCDSQSMTFCIPSDHAGLMIGKEGKNILEVERATNTSIKIDSRQASPRDKTYVKIKGSKENCEKAFLMINQKLRRKVSLHTAASETIKVPKIMVGRIIGKNGVTIEGIKCLSGAHDIKFSDRPVGFLATEQDCTIAGSHEEIEEAKKLIKQLLDGEDKKQVLDGEDVITNANIEALFHKLKSDGMGLEDENSRCVLS